MLITTKTAYATPSVRPFFSPLVDHHTTFVANCLWWFQFAMISNFRGNFLKYRARFPHIFLYLMLCSNNNKPLHLFSWNNFLKQNEIAFSIGSFKNYGRKCLNNCKLYRILVILNGIAKRLTWLGFELACRCFLDDISITFKQIYILRLFGVRFSTESQIKHHNPHPFHRHFRFIRVCVCLFFFHFAFMNNNLNRGVTCKQDSSPNFKYLGFGFSFHVKII